MLPLITEVSFDNFMSSFLSNGHDFTDEDAEEVGDFSSLCNLFSKCKGKEPKEHEMYPVIAEVVNKILQRTNKNFVYRDIANWYESIEDDINPGGCIFPVHARAQSACQLTDKERSDLTQSSRLPYAARMSWTWAEVIWEIKPSPTADGSAFFNNELGQSFLHTNSAGLAQFTNYAAELFRRQHRTHLFMVYITRTHARVVRWDRAAAVVSEAVDLKTSHRRLFNFISRLVTTTHEARGHDPTVKLANKSEIQKLEKYQREQDKLSKHYASEMLKHILDNRSYYPIYRVTCQCADDPKRNMVFLVGKDCSSHHSPTGRATKGFVAYNTAERRLVFLKDYWRPAAPSLIHPELETYKRLQKHEVPFIAYPVAGGDVGGSKPQVTRNQDYLAKAHQTPPLKRIHYRVVSSRVGRPLESYTSSMEMIYVVFHALRAHRDAWEKAKILHRDVSVNNILIDIDSPEDQPIGFLNDWDLCKYKEDLGKAATQNGRSGTWPFLSALLLKYPKKPTALSDDLESFVHVITWLALRFHEHGMTLPQCLDPDCDVATLLKVNATNTLLCLHKDFFFDMAILKDGHYVGHETKYIRISKFDTPAFELADRKGPLARLLSGLYSLLNHHYSAIDPTELAMYELSIPDPGPSRKYQPRGVIKVALKDPAMSKCPSWPLGPGSSQRSSAGSSQPSILGSFQTPVPDSSQLSASRSSASGHSHFSCLSNPHTPSAVPMPRTPSEIATGGPQRKYGLCPTRPLDNHTAIFAVFHEVTNGVTIGYDDKTADQFLGLGQICIAPPKGSSGASKGRSSSSLPPPQGQVNADVPGSQHSAHDMNTDFAGNTRNTPQPPSEAPSSSVNRPILPAIFTSSTVTRDALAVAASAARVSHWAQTSSKVHTISENEVVEFPGPALGDLSDTPRVGIRPVPVPDAVDQLGGTNGAPSQSHLGSPKKRGRKRKTDDSNGGGRKRRSARRG